MRRGGPWERVRLRRGAAWGRLTSGATRETGAAPKIPASDLGKTSNDLPKIAEKADDLEAIKKTVDDAATVGGGLWLSYLFVLFYLAVAAGAVKHQDLFFERPVKLPFLTGIELPLFWFFLLAPLLFLVVHAYTLVHLKLLTDKAKHYNQALYDQMGEKDGLSKEQSGERKAKREGLRRQLPSNIFIQFLAGPSDLREGWFGWLLRVIAWITLVITPVLLLLMMQIQFLPYHSYLSFGRSVSSLAPISSSSGGFGERFCRDGRPIVTTDRRLPRGQLSESL